MNHAVLKLKRPPQIIVHDPSVEYSRTRGTADERLISPERTSYTWIETQAEWERLINLHIKALHRRIDECRKVLVQDRTPGSCWVRAPQGWLAQDGASSKPVILVGGVHEAGTASGCEFISLVAAPHYRVFTHVWARVQVESAFVAHKCG